MSSQEDIIERTKRTYQSPEGAQAYYNKEMTSFAHRSDVSYQIIDDLDLKGKSILDIGCAFGRDMEEFQSRGADVYGIDISQELLNMSSIDPKRLKQHDLLSDAPIPFDMKFDLIWLYSVLVHVPRNYLHNTLCKIWGRLSTQGYFVIGTKLGNEDIIKNNLGEGLERIMIHYTKQDILDTLIPLGAIEDEGADVPSITPFGDDYISMRFKKQETQL